MDAATRITSAAVLAVVFAASALAACFLVGGVAGLTIGGVLVLGTAAAALFAAQQARIVTRKVHELRERTQAVGKNGDFGARLETIQARDEVDELQNVIARHVSSVSEPLQALSGAAEAISRGDLTVELSEQGTGSAAELVGKFGRMRDALKQLVSELQTGALDVTSSTEQLSAAIEEISSSIEEVTATISEVSRGAQSQSEQVNQASHNLRQTTEQLQRTAQEANAAVQRVRQAEESATGGAKNAADAAHRIGVITTRTEETAVMVRGFADNIGRISEFVKVIVRISDQTNLLALNAAIEAARAGEHGRGFTVVADEVRKLAEESAKGADEVQRVITHVTAETARIVASMETMTKEVKQGDDVVREAIGRFEEVTQQVAEISGLVTRMATSIDQVAQRGSEIAKNVESITATAEETAASSEQVSAALEEQTASIEQVATTSQVLARNAGQALESVRRFKTGDTPPPARGRRAAADMPPVFQAPPRTVPQARERIALKKYSDDRPRERRSG